MSDKVWPAQSAISVGLRGRCPRCGKGHLFSGVATLKPGCEKCGLSYDFADAGDGPAVFVMLIAGFIIVAAALVVEVKYQPPYWLHAALWLPLTILLPLALLRPLKGWLVATQYTHNAKPGELEGRD
ncbi:MAG: DUF983 domain-containing protein [Rhizobiales bacterium]|nr:DUF983 domain-containing protein [Hyphomicrobiales bacterium]